jgi:hypothetical protein
VSIAQWIHFVWAIFLHDLRTIPKMWKTGFICSYKVFQDVYHELVQWLTWSTRTFDYSSYIYPSSHYTSLNVVFPIPEILPPIPRIPNRKDANICNYYWFLERKIFRCITRAGVYLLPEIVPSDAFPSNATLHGLVPLKVWNCFNACTIFIMD